MIVAHPFTVDAMASVRLQPEQVLDTFDVHVATAGTSWSFTDGAGRQLAVGGLYPASERMAVAWAFVDRDVKRHMAGLVIRTREVIAKSRWPVIRAGVLEGFAAGERLVRLLGFRRLDASPIHYKSRVYQVFELVRS